jgi:hypothetical protein
MNVKKIALFAGVFCFVGISAAESWFDAGVFVKNKKPSTETLVFNIAAYVTLKESYSQKLAQRGTWKRVIKSNNWYSESDAKNGDARFFARPIAYIVADELVAPKVFNSDVVEAAVKNFSPETQRVIKEEVALLSASALAKSAEALYDNQYNEKALQQSAQEFALNAGTRVTSQVIYHSAVKPVIQEVITPGLQPVAEFATGYATAYVIMQMMNAVK